MCFHKMRQIATIFFNVISYHMSWTILEEANDKLDCLLPNKSEVEMEVGDFLGDGVLVRSEKELGCCSQQMQCVILLSICYSLQLIMHKKALKKAVWFSKTGKNLQERHKQEAAKYKKDITCTFCVYFFYFVRYATISYIRNLITINIFTYWHEMEIPEKVKQMSEQLLNDNFLCLLNLV